MFKSRGHYEATNIIKNSSEAIMRPLNYNFSSTLVDINRHLSPLKKRKVQGKRS